MHNKKNIVFFSFLLIAALSLIIGCGQQGGGGSGGTVTFTVAPLNIGDYKTVGPMGNLNPRMGHALPTDHGGFAFAQNLASVFYNVYSPASGTITEITYTENNWPAGSGQTGTYRDWMIKIRHTYDFYSTFGHLSSLEAAILAQAGTLQPNVANRVNIGVTAGQVIGLCGGRPGVVTGVDWYVADYTAATKSFINPNRYGRMIYSTHFFGYCTASLINLYTPLFYNADANPIVTRETTPLGGKIDFDIAGTLSGNWFHNSITTTEAAFNEYNKQLAFVYDQYEPAKVRVAFGGPEGAIGSEPISTPLGLWVTTYQVFNNRPDPATVNVASGEVVYWINGLAINNETTIEATLLVKIIDNSTISIEGFSGHLSSPSFTTNVQTYIR
jgi:hypothetical protein